MLRHVTRIEALMSRGRIPTWSTQLREARRAAGLSAAEVARRGGVSLSTVQRAEADTTDTGINLYTQLAIICGAELRLHPPTPTTIADSPSPPNTYPNPRRDDSWDNDAVQWLLTHDRALDEGWTRQILLECLRRQPHRVHTEPHRVQHAAVLAAAFGVEQHEIHDPNIGKTIIRLRRTDDAAPQYPDSR